MPIDIIGITSLLIALINIILGFYVFAKNPRKTNNIVYAVSVSSISVWIVLTYLYNNPSFWEPELWLKFVYLASYGMLLAQLGFAYFFPRKKKDKFWYFAIPIILSIIPSFYVLIIQDSVIVSAVSYPDKFMSIAQMGGGYFIYTLPNTLGIFLLAVYFLNKSKSFIGYEKAQINFYVLGALFMMVPLVIVDYGIPLINGDTKFFAYGPLFVIPFSVSLAYSILENRFLTIKNIFKKGLYFIANILFFVGCILLFLLFYEDYSLDNISIFVFGFSAVAMISYKLIFERMYSRISSWIFKEEIIKAREMKNFIQISNMELTMDRIVVNIKRTINQIFSIQRVGIILYDKNNFQIRYQNFEDFQNLNITELFCIIKYWQEISKEKVLVADEIKRMTILNQEQIPERVRRSIEFMDTSKISIILPFSSRIRLDGILLLGYRKDSYPLTIEEVGLLEQLIMNASVSIGRSILYQEVEAFNQTLQNKVDEQTKELQIRVEQLQEARRKERDMVDIMGHELRTPATIVKLNASLLEKYIDSNPADFKKYVDRIKDSIENEIKLINTLLTSAKLEGNRVEISNESVDIKYEIEMVLHRYELDAQSKGIILINQVLPDTPNIFADKVRTIEIIDNLVGNAVKYTKQGSVTIQTEYDDENVKVSVIDTGDGISQEEIVKLGQKFHRVDNYTGNGGDVEIVRPGGTGLGLFVVFGLVKLMHGKIWVESEVGKGSKFIFTLPRYNGQEVSGFGSNSKDMFERMGLKR